MVSQGFRGNYGPAGQRCKDGNKGGTTPPHPTLSRKGRDSTTDLPRIAPMNLVAPDVRRGFCPATSSPRWLRLLATGSWVGGAPRSNSRSQATTTLGSMSHFLSPSVARGEEKGE